MRKAIVALLLVGLCQGMAFGQEAAPVLKWKGLLSTGVWSMTNDSGTATTLYQRKTKKYGGSLELAGTYGTSTSGLSFTYRLENLTQGTGNLATNLEGAYAWAKVPGLSQVKVLAGSINDPTFDAIDDNGDALLRGNGAAVHLDVVPGLKVGALVDVINFKKLGTKLTATVTNPKSFDEGNWVYNTMTVSVDPVVGFGASYSIEGVADFVLAARSGPLQSDGYKAGLHDLSASLSWNGVENLWFVLGYNYNVLSVDDMNDWTNWDHNSTLPLTQQLIDFDLAYPIVGGLSAGLNSYVYLWSPNILNPELKAAEPSYAVTPSLSYALTPQITVQAAAKLANGWMTSKTTQVTLDPNFTVKFDKNCKLTAHYEYLQQSGENVKKDKTVQTLRAELQYKF